MRNHASQLIIGIKNDTIRTRRPPIVRIPRRQNRELEILAGDREIKVLVVMVLVGVVADVRVGGVELVAGLLGGGYGGFGVAVGAAGVGAGAGLDGVCVGGWEGGCKGYDGEENGEEVLLLG